MTSPSSAPAILRRSFAASSVDLAAWARTTAVCPACQVTPGIHCHTGGQPLHDGAVHPQRYTEADRASRAA